MTREDTVTITVYSQTPCVQCNAVKRKLTGEGATFEVDDITPLDSDSAEVRAEKENKLEALKALGYTRVPVTFVNDDHFYGYDIDKITDAIARQRRTALHVVEDAA